MTSLKYNPTLDKTWDDLYYNVVERDRGCGLKGRWNLTLPLAYVGSHPCVKYTTAREVLRMLQDTDWRREFAVIFHKDKRVHRLDRFGDSA